MEVLDNCVWHALTGPQARFAQRIGDAARYDPEVAPFAALPDAPVAAAWEALRELVGPGNGAALFRRDVVVPDGWVELARLPCLQLLAPSLDPPSDDGLRVLGADDVDAMLALIGTTELPFARRTLELGTYLGTREPAGSLRAMAGERIALPGHTEISAVCTAPEARGLGWGARLTRAIGAGIQARVHRALLHLVADNEPAVRLYERLGFRLRTRSDVVLVQAPR